MTTTGPAPSPTNSAAPTRAPPSFCQIETAEGVENADAIAAIDGVDCCGSVISICRFRWAFPAQFDNPKFTNAVERVVAAAASHNRALGRLVPTVEQGIECQRLGFDFICYSGDVWVLHDALAAALARLRAGCGKA